MLSVITITMNNPQELRSTVESLEGIPDIELIVINGGSCAETLEYLESIKGNIAKLQCLTESDQGIGDAFNKGVRLAGGEAVVFLNSGDRLISKTYFQRTMDLLAANKDIGFVHASIIFGDAICGDIELKPSLSSLGRGMPYRHQTMIVRRSIFRDIGLFDIGLKATMDFEFVCRMAKAGYQGHYDQVEPVVWMDGRGISSTNELFAYSEVLRVLWRHRLFTLENTMGTIQRYFTYFVRRLLVAMGLTNLLVYLKKRKHAPQR